jgi:hypothetical protein
MYTARLTISVHEVSSARSESAEWNIADEVKYEGLEKDIGRTMDHAPKYVLHQETAYHRLV